jgi:hypothetical protein
MTTNWPPTIQTDFIFYSVWDLVLLLSIVAVIIAMIIVFVIYMVKRKK